MGWAGHQSYSGGIWCIHSLESYILVLVWCGSTGQKYNDMYIYVHNTRIFMYFLLLGSEIWWLSLDNKEGWNSGPLSWPDLEVVRPALAERNQMRVQYMLQWEVTAAKSAESGKLASVAVETWQRWTVFPCVISRKQRAQDTVVHVWLMDSNATFSSGNLHLIVLWCLGRFAALLFSGSSGRPTSR